MTSFINNETFSEADHQLIGMKLSYQAEEITRSIEINDRNSKKVKNNMLKVYRKHLDNKKIKLVENLPQYFKDKIPIKPISSGMNEIETGFHANAITKGDPKNPKEITVVFPGTDFDDGFDVQQTSRSQSKRHDDYSERAIKYIGQVKEKYPNAEIVVDGHSMAGKIAIQIGLIYPDVTVYAFNPTAIDSEYHKLIEEGKHYDNINVLIFDNDIAKYERWFQYFLKSKTTGSLPFNTYHIDPDKLQWIQQLPAPHDGIFDHHSTGGFRGVDGSLWDIFNLTPIGFSASNSGTTEINFDKERYLHFSNVLEHQMVPYLRKAIPLIEQMEEEIDEKIREIITRAEQQIESVKFESTYPDPRPGAIESLKDKFYRSGKYRCYEEESMLTLLDALHRSAQEITQSASKIVETAEAFERIDTELAKKNRAKESEDVWKKHRMENSGGYGPQ
ncbi:hypothetical protein H1Z61_07300 [Bacillus aquiflavi]|uniref:Lipase family protein n=1 Tax=Bacillus aquiflavi TaxID=2672567 RepID=A0A6B3VVR7_9BACI|nr:lipase family protein [Bacillus aquiflavi]MBA4536954.1 hypothetical protein [Bacillus aquiflavi]NEY82340.1 lipase family protein [Bacillus aquiflavi]UAC47769.1 lipase family protein [Bacillus aquiflavi]